MQNPAFQIDMSVRDYECDIQGIVNNAVYQNYLEHARHEYLKSENINFTELSMQGTNLVVVRIEMDYHLPLASGDEFYVTVIISRESKLKFAFEQKIFRRSDNRLMLSAKVTGVALDATGRPKVLGALEALIQ